MRSSNLPCCAYFEITFEELDIFNIDFGELTEITITDYYDGEYVITPKDFDQILETEEKAMRDDVTVLAVPYTEVDNPYGGVTCIIGN